LHLRAPVDQDHGGSSTNALRRVRDAKPRPLDKDVVSTAPEPASFGTVMLGLNTASAQIQAMVRAFERAQGAAIRGEDAFAQSRSREAAGFARAGSEILRTVSPAMTVLADALPQESDNPQQLRAVPRDPSELSTTALAFLYRAGVSISQLRQALRTCADLVGLAPVRRVPEALRPAGEAAVALSDVLADWKPVLGDRAFGS
jgi:hypothetical protein